MISMTTPYLKDEKRLKFMQELVKHETGSLITQGK